MRAVTWLNEKEVNKQRKNDKSSSYHRHDLYKFQDTNGKSNWIGYANDDKYEIMKKEEFILNILELLKHSYLDPNTTGKDITKLIEDYGQLQYQYGRHEAEEDFAERDSGASL
jgi:hypothetical protein